jgi:NAD(P)-dependent dehydrogenase (short-subunit alcohol dehydrogenase family)
MDEAAAGLGGIDALVDTVGVGPLAGLVDIEADSRRTTLEANGMGGALITIAALPGLSSSGGVVAYPSSVSASITAPWPGLETYIVSKAALDKSVEGWRLEHPRARPYTGRRRRMGRR